MYAIKPACQECIGVQTVQTHVVQFLMLPVMVERPLGRLSVGFFPILSARRCVSPVVWPRLIRSELSEDRKWAPFWTYLQLMRTRRLRTSVWFRSISVRTDSTEAVAFICRRWWQREWGRGSRGSRGTSRSRHIHRRPAETASGRPTRQVNVFTEI